MIFEFINEFFRGLVSAIPEKYVLVTTLFLYTIFIVLYAFFIWKFYRFLAKREIITLNLSQYNTSDHPFFEKFWSYLLDTIEYLIILPFLVLFWFSVFALFILLLSKSQSTHQILLMTAAIIASTRITAYISQDLSKDIAKIFPFTVLAFFLLDREFFNLESIFDKISQIPELFNNILIFILFILVVEFILRGVYSLYKLIKSM